MFEKNQRILIFRTRNTYLAKISKTIRKIVANFNKKGNDNGKIRRYRRRCIICVRKSNTIVTYI